MTKEDLPQSLIDRINYYASKTHENYFDGFNHRSEESILKEIEELNTRLNEIIEHKKEIWKEVEKCKKLKEQLGL
jgi:hypothetical protein